MLLHRAEMSMLLGVRSLQPYLGLKTRLQPGLSARIELTLICVGAGTND